MYRGTSPYQEIPFQYSLMDQDGIVTSYLLPPGEHPDLLQDNLRRALKGFDVLVTDTRFKMQDARWHGEVIQLMDYFAELSLPEMAERLIGDNSLISLKLNKDILVADAYNDMVHGNEDPELGRAIQEYGKDSVMLLKKIFDV